MAVKVPAGYKQTELGVIPEQWSVKPIGDLQLFVTSGSRGWATFYSDRGFPFIRIANLRRDCIYPNLDDLQLVNIPENASEAVRTKLQDGDVLISITADIGVIGYVTKELQKPAYINQHIALVRLEPDSVCAKFVGYFLASESSQRRLRALTDAGAKAGMNLTTVKETPVALPPTKVEQEVIAEALSDADALIESLDQLIAKKRQIKQGAMQELLTGKRRLPGFSGEWDVKQFGDVVERFVGGGTPSRANPDYWGDEIPWATVKDFATFNSRQTQEYITKTGLENSSSSLIPKGTLITSTRMALGKAVIYDVDVAINQDLKAIFQKQILDAQYLFFWFQHHGRFIDELGSGSTVKGISLPELKKIDFQVPPLSEQTVIATLLSDMDTELAALASRLAKARQIKQGMMQELLTGRIRLLSKC